MLWNYVLCYLNNKNYCVNNINEQALNNFNLLQNNFASCSFQLGYIYLSQKNLDIYINKISILI